ncbi:amidohydrolase family protein [Altericroceibacterium xinjiangense]|uniref:amidohydrolase family protein n=1 Tax=Altericroceibacterium xinjiangense TaxID=762261 RepID=UPI0019D29FE5|nr:amidohydrolase family protein [Altericroceibacterium xinjiangense]
MPRPLLIRNAYVMTMGAAGDLPRADVLVRGGEIAAVGIGLAADGAEVIDARGQILLPGFVDTHNHLWLSQMRGLFGRSPETRYFRLTERLGAAYRPEDMRIGTLFGAAGALEAGITTTLAYCDNIRTPEDAEAALSGLIDAGIRARFLYAGHDKLAPDVPLAIDHLASLHRNRAAWAGEAPIDLGLGWRTPTASAGEAVLSVALEELRRIRAIGLPVSTHISGDSGPDQLDLLISRGLLGQDMVLVHATGAEPEALRAVQDAGSAIALTPITEQRVGFGLTRLKHYTDRVSRVGLGIDGALAGAPDMFAVMRAGHLVQAAVSGDELAMLPRQVLELATIEAARAIRLDSRIGSLEPGKLADLILIDTQALNMGFPVSDPSSLLVYSARPENVSTVMVGGNVVKRDSQLTQIDSQRLVASADRSLGKIRERADAAR